MDELSLIAKIRERLSRDDARVALGVGDDAAILAPLARGAVLSVDAAVEGVHFDRRWISLDDAGFRAYVAALSDLAAMGAAPVAGLLSFIVPRGAPDEDVLRMIDGAAEAAAAYGAPIVGGNLSSGRELAMSTTVVGEAPARPFVRGGARPGDAVYVTGTVGAAALGLALLARDEAERDGAAVFVARWRRPRARFDCAALIADAVTSAIDVSDGLAGDLEHLCEASGVGAVVESARVPVEARHHELAQALGLDGTELALAGGEDYELVFTAKEGAIDPRVATCIGTIVPERGVRVLDVHGSEIPLSRRGHIHR